MLQNNYIFCQCDKENKTRLTRYEIIQSCFEMTNQFILFKHVIK